MGRGSYTGVGWNERAHKKLSKLTKNKRPQGAERIVARKRGRQKRNGVTKEKRLKAAGSDYRRPRKSGKKAHTD